jgi:undecaprenyl-diphosphatase
MAIMHTLITTAEWIDKEIFSLINGDLSAGWLDPVMLLLRDPRTWIPLYAGMLIYSIWKMPSQWGWFVAFSLLTFAITDWGSARLLKPWIGRLRPCFDPDLMETIRSLIPCGGENSMPSTHASNHFGLAMIWFCCIRSTTGQRWHWLWVWASLIGYAQVYVGKHFPGDILAGAVFGMFTGWCIYKIAEKWGLFHSVFSSSRSL